MIEFDSTECLLRNLILTVEKTKLPFDKENYRCEVESQLILDLKSALVQAEKLGYLTYMRPRATDKESLRIEVAQYLVSVNNG